MAHLLRYLPQTLVGRVFALYSASLLTFTVVGLGLFYHYQFTKAIDEAFESASVLADVMAPVISDSVVIGDYDTVRRLLAKTTVLSQLASTSFLDLKGGVVRTTQDRPALDLPARWINTQVSQRLFDINQNISVGGRDYGVLRLGFASDVVALEIWRVTRTAILLAGCAIILGLLAILLPLRRWLGGLDRLHQLEKKLESGSLELNQLLESDAPTEVRRTIAMIGRVAMNLRAYRNRADVTLGAITDGVVSTDEKGCIVYANPVAERIFASSDRPLLGNTIDAVLPGYFNQPLPQLVQGHQNVQRIEIKSAEFGICVLDAILSPIASEDGKICGFVMACRDVTESHRLEAQLRVELQVSEDALNTLHVAIRGMLSASELHRLNVTTGSLGSVARLISLLVQEREQTRRDLDNQKHALDEHAIVSITNASGEITYVNQKFSEISGYTHEELLGSNHRIVKSSEHPAEFYDEMWATLSQGKVWHGQLANRHKSGSVYWVASTIVPWLDDAGLPYQYVSIRTDITAQKQVEQALEQARKRELATGADIQRALLLGDLPDQIWGAQLATYTESSQGIDGDFFAITRFSSDCFELLVGDVMGKGVPAALIGAGVKTSYHKVLAQLLARPNGPGGLPTPADIVNALHQSLTGRLIELGSFVTLALYRIDISQGTLTFVNAGHTPGLLAHADAQELEEILGENMPIGVLADELYVQTTIALREGDALLVYSDGITEARNHAGEEFGQDRLTQLIRMGRQAELPPNAFLQSLRQQVRTFVGSDILLDDQTALLMEFTPRRSAHRDTLSQRVNPELLILPWRLDGLHALRSAIVKLATDFLDEDVDQLTLASFEAATNILRHAKPYFSDATVTCRLIRSSDTLSVELIYPGSVFEPPDSVTPDFSGASSGGFGLYIMEQCVDRVAYIDVAPGISSICLAKHGRGTGAQGLALDHSSLLLEIDHAI